MSDMSTTNARHAHPLILDFAGPECTDGDRALIASLSPAELSTVTAAATETAQVKIAEIRARR